MGCLDLVDLCCSHMGLLGRRMVVDLDPRVRLVLDLVDLGVRCDWVSICNRRYMDDIL